MKREELIERAARAISMRRDGISLPTPIGVFVSRSRIGEYMADAQAALTAILEGLREPSAEMLEAGADNEGSFSRIEARRVSLEVWQAMLSTLDDRSTHVGGEG